MSEAEPGSKPEAKPLPRLGSYLLKHQLGSGGMSNVFRAVHEESGSIVAVKVLPRTLAKNVTLLQRFIREAKSAEALDHPNIVSIFDRGFDQGRHYLVLEYVEGRDLHDRVKLGGPMGIAESILLVREVAEGLRYAAGQGMVHRDIKPANLLVTPDGHAKIIDLGLALQADDEDERVTRDGTTVGTVDYMSPEQARDSRKTNERSDIYSLGCTYHYLLTGFPPYPGGGLADKLSRHYSAPVPDVRERRPEVPEPLALLVKKMMAKKPEGRFADYSLLIAALDGLANPPSPSVPAAPLDVLFDDDDDDETFGLMPTETEGGKSRGGGEPTAPYLTAEIVDDDDDEAEARPPSGRPASGRPLSGRPPSGRPPSGRPPSPGKSGEVRRETKPTPTSEISLADLAALDADEPPARPVPRKPAGPVAATLASPAFADLDEGDDDDEPVEGRGRPMAMRRGGEELSLKTWIAAGVMVGVAIALVGFGVSLVLSLTRPPEPETVADANPPASSNDSETATPIVLQPRGPRPGPARPPVTPRTADLVATPITAPLDVTRPAPAEEKSYPPDWIARFLPPRVGPDRLRPIARGWWSGG